jgi:oxygen-dependent protoporphyrinogen oxidase
MPDSSHPLRIAIVGGGITGLAAAHASIARARERGRAAAVTVLEASARFGGNLVTEQAGGFVFDGGPDSWVASKPQASALARELGLAGELVGTNPETRRYFVAWNGRLHPVPEGLVLGVPTRLAPLAATRLFSWPGKARMACEPLVRARRYDGDDDDDESIADFASRRLGREAAERLVAPLLGGISAGDASQISVLAAFPQLVAMERDHGSLVRGMRAARRAREAAAKGEGQANGKGSGTAGGSAGGKAKGASGEPSAFVSLRPGVGELVRALVERLRAEGVMLRTGAVAQAMRRAGDVWTIDLGEGEPVEADAVLLAVPAYAAERLVARGDADLTVALSRIGYGSTATVFLAYRRADVAHPLDGVGFVVPRALGRPILAGTWVSSKWSARAPEGHVLVRAFVGGPQGEALVGRDDAALVSTVRSELRALMGLDAEPVLTRVFRFERASAQMRIGHLGTMRALRERLARVAPGVYIAGGGYDGVGIPDCIRQGQEAAEAMVARAAHEFVGASRALT